MPPMHDARYTIADHIADGRPVIAFGGDVVTRPEDPANLKQAELVRADEPAAWYSMDESVDDWGFGGKQYGPLRMPYPNMWIEWDLPNRYVAEGRSGRPPIRGSAVWLMEMDKEFTENFITEHIGASEGAMARRNLLWASRVMWGNVYIVGHDGRVTTPGSIIVGTDEAGAYKGMYRVTYGAGTSEEDQWRVGQIVAEACRPGFIALGLMNCRNVKIGEPVTPKIAPNHLKKMKGRIPRLSFRTIRLPLPASASASAKAAVTQDVMPFHMVRGHFKTYTEDAPLMGRLTGTYWWGWHSRGKKANGIARRDYEVVRPS